jgi:L-fuculose-phosphate aldolase
LALGSEPLDALRRLDVLETLARMTMAATELQDEPTLVTTEQAADIPRQRPVEPRPSRDYRRYYRSLDPGVDAPGPDLDPPRNEVDRVKRDVAHACRLLASAGDLVAFFEHVSHRIPGADDRFAMSPAKDFASMRPDDIGIIAVEGECEQLEGDIPAAPFRWYHRDVFAARPDVTAIVHTHELLGRAYVAAGAAPPPVHRAAAHGLRGHTPPVFRTPSLLFDASDRADMVTLLGDGPWVHSLAHGTDYCASDIAVATRAAIERERHLRFHSMARRLGQPTVLSDDVLDGLEAQLATAQQWWEASTEALP